MWRRKPKKYQSQHLNRLVSLYVILNSLGSVQAIAGYIVSLQSGYRTLIIPDINDTLGGGGLIHYAKGRRGEVPVSMTQEQTL